MRPFFSIVVPIYNVEKYLKECLDSILAQTFSDFEVILVNDGSTDDCPLMCEMYSQKDSRLRVLNQKNQGLLMARRNGLKRATGQYIVHIDSDDSCKPNMLEELFKTIQSTEADLVIYGFDLINEKSVVIKKGIPVFEQNRIVDFTDNKEEFIKTSFETHGLNNIWIKCAKKEIVDIDTDYSNYGRLMMGEDILQSMPLYENANKIVYLGEALYLYRVNTLGMSRAMKKEYLLHYLLVRKRVYEMVLALDLSQELKKYFYKYYIHYFANYAIKLSLITSRKEYLDLIDIAKNNLIDFDESFSDIKIPIEDYLANQICVNKRYHVAKFIAKWLLSRK